MPLFTSFLSILGILVVVDLTATKVKSFDHLFVKMTFSGILIIWVNIVIAILDFIFEIIDIFDSLALVCKEIEVS